MRKVADLFITPGKIYHGDYLFSILVIGIASGLKKALVVTSFDTTSTDSKTYRID